MKKLIILPILFIAIICQAQQIIYTYDGAGNRISRAVDGVKYTMPKDEDEDETAMKLSSDAISVYPNPTDGPLEIAISGFDKEYSGEVKIYNISGQIVLQQKITESKTSLNLTGYAHGMYLVNITVNDTATVWKVIKK